MKAVSRGIGELGVNLEQHFVGAEVFAYLERWVEQLEQFSLFFFAY